MSSPLFRSDDYRNDDFDRRKWIRDKHVSDLPEECTEVLKILYCGYENYTIAAILGISERKVRTWLDYAVDRICGGWPDSRPTDFAAFDWFLSHRFCCTVEASQEVLYQEYLGATRFGIEQPGAHRRRQDAGIRGDCRLRRPPSGDAASRRGWFRKGCGQLTAQQLEELRQDSPPEPGDHESPPSVS